jgi:N-methylhydantoinase A
VEIVNFRVTAFGVVDKPDLPRWRSDGSLDQAAHETRQVWFGGAAHDTPVFDRALLASGLTVRGPAIVEESGSTTLLPPGWSAQVLEFGDLLLERD